MSSNMTTTNMTETDYYESYDASMTHQIDAKNAFQNGIRMLYVVAYLICCVLGLTLNSYVIFAGFRAYHRFQKPATAVWVLALALTHLVFSGFLVFQVLYAWNHFNWHYGEALCKISSYMTYVSMFSTAALLSLWSLRSSRCFRGTKCCGHTTLMILILSSWMFGAAMSSPSLLSRELRDTELGLQCIDDYDSNKEKTTDDGVKNLTAVALSRFLLGILVPGFVIFGANCLRARKDLNEDKRCKRVTCAIKVAYFVCWTPLLTVGLIQSKTGNLDSFTFGLPAATVLSAAHCFINPVIYLLVGRKINMQWMSPAPDNTDNHNECIVLSNTMQ